jgi:hypothetical protein
MGKQIEVEKAITSIKVGVAVYFACPFCGAEYRGRWLVVGRDWGVKIERNDGKKRFCPHYTGETERMGDGIVAFIFLKTHKAKGVLC